MSQSEQPTSGPGTGPVYFSAPPQFQEPFPQNVPQVGPPAPVGPPTPLVGPPGPTPVVEERVGRGLLFSLGGIVVGVVLTVILWKLNFIAAITSFALAYVAIWLYTRGAGGPPRKGALGVVVVIVVGVLACLASLVATDTLTYIATAYPDAPAALQLRAVVENLLAPDVWSEYTNELFMYLVFAALGTFGLIRQLGRARGA